MAEKFIPESVTNLESKETKELRAATMRGILLWMDRLEKIWQAFEKKPKLELPKSLRLGAAFIPATLIGLSTGCQESWEKNAREGGWEIVECSEDEQEYIIRAFDWLVEHPQEIQAQMDLLWPDTNIGVTPMLETLQAARIDCGYQTVDYSVVGGGSKEYQTIIVNVDTDGFQNNLEMVQQNSWVADYDLDSLIKNIQQTGDLESADDIASYYFFLSSMTKILLHETGHLVYDLNHVGEQTNEVLRDPVDAWGKAAGEATNEYGLSLYHQTTAALNPEP